jgi:hypothetical protein
MRTLRIRHFNGLDFSIESFDLTAPAVVILLL